MVPLPVVATVDGPTAAVVLGPEPGPAAVLDGPEPVVLPERLPVVALWDSESAAVELYDCLCSFSFQHDSLQSILGEGSVPNCVVEIPNDDFRAFASGGQRLSGGGDQRRVRCGYKIANAEHNVA